MQAWSAAERKKAELLLAFLQSRGEVHPREVEEHFAHGRVRNYWGGSSNATTQMLDALHYRGLVRVVRRENGIRIYRTHRHQPARAVASAGFCGSSLQARIDALVDVVVNIYAPLPGSSLSFYIRRLRYAVPQWRSEITAGQKRARERLPHARVAGMDWYWPSGENPRRMVIPETVRLLTPFDPVVHDRTRFELLWNWTYRFEAYTPAPKRKLGYYALPLLWRDRVIGWTNLTVKNGALLADSGYVQSGPPTDRAFQREFDAELDRIRFFLRLHA